MIHASTMRSICVGLSCLGFFATGCARGPEEPRSGETPRQSEVVGQGITIDFRSEPNPPRPGDNALEVTVKDRDGLPVTDATVTAVLSMPAMPSMNMPAMRVDSHLTHEADGRYGGKGELSMDGTWTVTITVSRGSEELGTKRLSVIAR